MNKLSPREEEIVSLCIQGMTNEGIAQTLGISIGTVNTYWLRIRMKTGTSGRTESVAKIIAERADIALRAVNVERESVHRIIQENERHVVDLRAALALFQLAMEQIKSTVWATDRDLCIHILANGEYPSKHFGVVWEPGKTVYEVFKTKDDSHPAVACHLRALSGRDCTARLSGEFANLSLRVSPLRDEQEEVMGCISILNTVAGE